MCGPDFRSVQEKQITIPVIIPWALENFLLSALPQTIDDLPQHFTNFSPLIPVHDPTRYDPNISGVPSLHDTASEKGNLRFWIITNESMWAGQHRMMDEFAELMWPLFYWYVILNIIRAPWHTTIGPDMRVMGICYGRKPKHDPMTQS